jgi:RimJ/RimL family protein N-acetyltransferase
MKRCDIEDLEMVENIMKDERVFDDIRDDQIKFVDEIDMRQALNNEMVYVLSPNKYCMIMFIPLNLVTYDSHICSLPEFKGKELVEFGKESIVWMFENTSCQKIVANIPEYNRKAIIYALLCGFEKEGINKKSFLKDEKLYDQISLGLCKEVILCHQQ